MGHKFINIPFLTPFSSSSISFSVASFKPCVPTFFVLLPRLLPPLHFIHCLSPSHFFCLSLHFIHHLSPFACLFISFTVCLLLTSSFACLFISFTVCLLLTSFCLSLHFIHRLSPSHFFLPVSSFHSPSVSFSLLFACLFISFTVCLLLTSFCLSLHFIHRLSPSHFFLPVSSFHSQPVPVSLLLPVSSFHSLSVPVSLLLPVSSFHSLSSSSFFFSFSNLSSLLVSVNVFLTKTLSVKTMNHFVSHVSSSFCEDIFTSSPPPPTATELN